MKVSRYNSAIYIMHALGKNVIKYFLTSELSYVLSWNIIHYFLLPPYWVRMQKAVYKCSNVVM